MWASAPLQSLSGVRNTTAATEHANLLKAILQAQDRRRHLHQSLPTGHQSILKQQQQSLQQIAVFGFANSDCLLVTTEPEDQVEEGLARGCSDHHSYFFRSTATEHTTQSWQLGLESSNKRGIDQWLQKVNSNGRNNGC